MRTAKEIINEFKAIADNPRKAMDDYKKETGKGAVGIMPVYCPEEIVHAAGYLQSVCGVHRRNRFQKHVLICLHLHVPLCSLSWNYS